MCGVYVMCVAFINYPYGTNEEMCYAFEVLCWRKCSDPVSLFSVCHMYTTICIYLLMLLCLSWWYRLALHRCRWGDLTASGEGERRRRWGPPKLTFVPILLWVWILENLAQKKPIWWTENGNLRLIVAYLIGEEAPPAPVHVILLVEPPQQKNVAFHLKRTRALPK